MALETDVKSCLMWETERPYLDRPRKSSYFSLFGEEWYLQITIVNNNNAQSLSYCVRLYRRLGEKTLETPILTTCHVIVPNRAMQDSSGFNSKRSVKNSSDKVFESYVSKDDYSTTSYFSGNWIVCCRLSCEKPISIHMNNETIHLSTVKGEKSSPASVDKCVQVTPEIPRDMEALSSDIYTLLQDEIFPDFELKCGGRNFPVHRSVLAARSEVFRAMFHSRMLENETGSADIKDLEAPVLESLLKFIYSGKLEQVSDGTAVDLYITADKYAVHCLRTACSRWMKRNLSHENCVTFLDIADSHSDLDLRAAVVSFIIKHPAVLKTAAWLTFSKHHQELANEVLQMYVSSIIQ